MATIGSNAILLNWLQRPRNIEWFFTLGINGRRKPNVKGILNTTLNYLDDQGEKWGETYIKVIGQHYDDYSHWNSVRHLLPIGGTAGVTPFAPHPFIQRQYKEAAPGVTGLIGEVLVTVFLQKVLNLSMFEIAHLKSVEKAPDLCLDISPQVIANIFDNETPVRPPLQNALVSSEVSQFIWSEPLPVECKSRRGSGSRQLRSALLQLINYWRRVPSMAGYGIFAQIDVVPNTIIRFHLLAPKPNYASEVRRIITGEVSGTDLPTLPVKPTVVQFNEILGGKLLGGKIIGE